MVNRVPRSGGYLEAGMSRTALWGLQGHQVVAVYAGFDGGTEAVALAGPVPRGLVDYDAGGGLVQVLLVLVQDPGHEAARVVSGQVRGPAAGLVGVPVEVVTAQDEPFAVLVE